MRIIAGTARGRKLEAPAGLATRPTTDRVKEAMFSIVQFELEGRRVLDLFAGSGQLGLEAISRGASGATFVDAGKDAVRVIRENIRRCGFEAQSVVVQRDYENFLQTCRESYDIILLDPPYGEKFLENALKLISEIDILRTGGIIICEKTADKVQGLAVLREKLVDLYGEAIALRNGIDENDAVITTIDKTVDALNEISIVAHAQTNYTHVDLKERFELRNIA